MHEHIMHMCQQVYQAVFKQPGNEASYDHFMIEGFMTCGV